MPDARRILARIRQAVLLVLGIPDYEAYLAHCRERHGSEPPMDRAMFVSAAQQKRLSGRAGSGRCC